MKKIIALLFTLLIIAAPASAKPVADEYRSSAYDFSSIKTVLVMPVMYDVAVPSNEPFFDEKTSQRWRDLTAQGKMPFLVKTPAEVVERENFVKGVAEPEMLSPTKTAERALALSNQYVDAVLTANVTKCGHNSIHHPQEIVWHTRYERRDVWVRDHWEQHEYPVSYQEVKPAWDEVTTVGSVKLELRDAKSPDNTLIYGVSVTAETGGDLFTSAPSLTKHIGNILENAVKRIPKK